jgi:hypothetical protein
MRQPMKKKLSDVSLAPFTWAKDPAGYRWESGYRWQIGQTSQEIRASDAVDVLVPNSCERVPYEPPANLFMLLKDTPPTKRGVLDFANNFGMLDLNTDTSKTIEAFARERMRLGLRRPELPSRDNTPTVLSDNGSLICEPLAKWHDAIRDLKYAVSRWDVARGAVTDDKNDHPGSAKIDLQQVFYEQLRSAVAVEASLHDLRSTGVTLMRFASVPTVVVDHPRMGRVTMSKRDYDPAQHGPVLARPKTAPHASGPETRVSLPTKFRFPLVAQTLLGFCWWQLKLAVQGDVQFRRCLACGQMMIVAPETPGPSHARPRQSRKTCGDSCRIRLSYYRSRYRSGRISIAEIAARLNSDAQTVRGWLKG